jgi:hypothetical protein
MRISKTPISKIATVAALAGCLAAPAFAAEPQVPRLDVTPTCRPLDKSDNMQLDENRCRKIETDARDQLTRQWANYPAADRSQCIATATMGGTASYVELITCLEMKRDVANLPANGLRSKPTGLETNH